MTTTDEILEQLSKQIADLWNFRDSAGYDIAVSKAKQILATELKDVLEDKDRLNYAILYPRNFTKLMETRAHGGFVEEELRQGRQAITAAMQQTEK